MDTGATKSVIGANAIPELLRNLTPSVKEKLSRCQCKVTFRFGNHGTLDSNQALVVPIGDLRLKVAIVPGNTPFLLSNTLLRTLGAVIDTEKQEVVSRLLQASIPLHLNSKGLFLIDLNDLVVCRSGRHDSPAETFAHCDAEKEKADAVSLSSPIETHQIQSGNGAVKLSQGILSGQSQVQHPSSKVKSLISQFEKHAEFSSPSNLEVAKRNFSKSLQHGREVDRSPQSCAVQSGHGRSNGSLHTAVRPPDGTRSCGFRKHICGKDLRGDVVESPKLDQVHDQSLREVHQNQPSQADPLCVSDDREAGVDQRGCRFAKLRASTIGADVNIQSQGKEQECSQGKTICNHREDGRTLGARESRGKCIHDRTGEYNADNAESDAQHGECLAGSDCSHPPPSTRDAREELSEAWIVKLSEAGDCDASFAESTCKNRNVQKFDKLVEMISQEFDAVKRSFSESNPKRIQLLEVFCSSKSELTKQVQQLGFRAVRHGMTEGDLGTTDGRRNLLLTVLSHPPDNIWYSPTCGPWSSWNQLNQSKSIEMFDAIAQAREQHLYQLALGVVLYRHQKARQAHMHWEQPGKSIMFRMPLLAVILSQTFRADFDLCRVGELRDPVNQMLMKKALEIQTTSRSLFEALHGRTCNKDHKHQQIEGNTCTKEGCISRARYSEDYPRKFARTVAKVLTKVRFPKERPHDPFGIVLASSSSSARPRETSGEEQSEVPPRKKLRSLTLQKSVPTIRLISPQEAEPMSFKRRRISGKSPEKTNLMEEMLGQVMSDVGKQLPRVGKHRIVDVELLRRLQECFPDMQIKHVTACRGLDRTMPPPASLLPEEAPFRRAVIIHREDGRLRVEDQWEEWKALAKRQIIRKGHPCRINLTMFAQIRNKENINDNENKNINVEKMQLAREPHERELSLRSPSLSYEKTPEEIQVHGPRFTALSKEEQSLLKQIHQNLGHPSPGQLGQVLRQQGHSSKLVQGLADMKCSTCMKHQKPWIQRPATLKHECDFGDKVSIDGVKWTNSRGESFHFYHMIDHGTNYHVAVPAPNRSAENAVENVIQGWFFWAGAPNELWTDSATEFTSETFENFLKQNNVKQNTTTPEAHWQLGKAERHGSILQSMLDKYQEEHQITSYRELQTALAQCTAAKNALSLRKGFSPNVLVFGKELRLPGSNSSDEMLSAHSIADSESAHGISFRHQLAMRETARRAFHAADNEAAIRRALLRRTRPDRGKYYPGEWIMYWKQQLNKGEWIGPVRVVVQDGEHAIWCTVGNKLFRVAPENARPLSTAEALSIPMPTTQEILQPTIPNIENVEDENSENHNQQENNPARASLNEESSPPSENEDPPPQGETSSGSHESQPDCEPEVSELNQNIDPAEIPIPTDDDDELVCDYLLSVEDNKTEDEEQAWRLEFEITDDDVAAWKAEDNPYEMAFLASNTKKTHAEVKLTQLTPAEKEEFKRAKQTEIQSWLKTGTVGRILRSQLQPEQIIRCRWILTWKALDPSDIKKDAAGNPIQTHKAKARLVVLGYLDPEIETIPRDSPTLNRHSRNLLLQMITSKGWLVKSFDVKAAFLQGKTQEGRCLAVEPVQEFRDALKLGDQEVLKLNKSAYGLIDAPFLWFQELDRTLQSLGFRQSPFDPCLYVLFSEDEKSIDGIIGMHVDDGLGGGNSRFEAKLDALERKFTFGSKKAQTFNFTGIEIHQNSEGQIQMSQKTYVNKINPIKIAPQRRANPEAEITTEERHELRALIGSLQYAAVNTRPDLSSRLSYLQSEINRGKVATLVEANKVLHEAKNHSDVKIVFQPIKVEDLRFLAFSDASFASKKNPESHAGQIILATHKDISLNYSCPISALAWGCKKIQKVVVSTLAAETMSLSSTLDQLSWMRLFWAWFMNPNIDWKHPKETLQKLPKYVSSTTAEVQQNAQSIAVTDCKSLFDLVTRTAPPNCQEFRTALQAKAIKDLLSEGVALRWVHSGAQLADSLTKIMENKFLRYTLQTGRYRLNDELQILKERADSRSRIKWLNQTEKTK